MKNIILASQSNARKELFSSLGIPFKTVPANIDEEKIRDKNLSLRAKKLARTKAEKVLSLHKDSVIIAADTFDCVGSVVLEKPKDKVEAKKMMNLLSSNTAVAYTGFCYIDHENKIDFVTVVKVVYTFRKLYKHEIDEYVEKFPVTQWAAGFALVFPYTNTFIASVKGSLSGLSYGLPMEHLVPLLKKSGFEPNPTR